MLANGEREAPRQVQFRSQSVRASLEEARDGGARLAGGPWEAGSLPAPARLKPVPMNPSPFSLDEFQEVRFGLLIALLRASIPQALSSFLWPGRFQLFQLPMRHQILQWARRCPARFEPPRQFQVFHLMLMSASS